MKFFQTHFRYTYTSHEARHYNTTKRVHKFKVLVKKLNKNNGKVRRCAKILRNKNIYTITLLFTFYVLW